MKGVRIVLVAYCVFVSGCASSLLGFDRSVEDESHLYNRDENHFAISLVTSGSYIGHGFLREYNKKCYLVSANHIFESGYLSSAQNGSIDPIRLNTRPPIPSIVFDEFDFRIYDVSNWISGCPIPMANKDASFSNLDNLSLTLRLASSDSRTESLKWHTVPSRPELAKVFKVKPSNEQNDLKKGYSGSLVSLQGVPIGIFLRIDDSGTGEVLPITTIDDQVSLYMSKFTKEKGSSQNRKILYGLLGVGVLGILVSGSGNGSSSSLDTAGPSIRIPIP